jgi:hypothetical protein
MPRGKRRARRVLLTALLLRLRPQLRLLRLVCPGAAGATAHAPARVHLRRLLSVAAPGGVSRKVKRKPATAASLKAAAAAATEASAAAAARASVPGCTDEVKEAAAAAAQKAAQAARAAAEYESRPRKRERRSDAGVARPGACGAPRAWGAGN